MEELHKSLYRTLRRIREFEGQVVSLVEKNLIYGVAHEYIGQEAVATGVCSALEDRDILTSTHRGHGHVLAKGADPSRMMAELLGRETGLNRGRGGSMHVADVSRGIYGANGIVGAGAPIAVGAAFAARARGEDAVAVPFFGDGALNQGVVMEAMNMAALWRLPMVFVCENNGYAVSLPVDAAVAGDPVKRARAMGMNAERVDGMDVLKVREAAVAAVERARSGGGPTFIECTTYRFRGHHTAEAVMRLDYRSSAEIEQWQTRDPLGIQGARLEPADRQRIDSEIEAEIAAAVKFAEESPKPDASTAYDHMYSSGLVARQGVS